MSEQQTKISPEIQLEQQLAIRRSKKLAVLYDTIPSWPESFSLVFSILFVSFVNNAPNDSEVAKILTFASFLIAMSCQWHTTRKLRSKVEALSEVVRNSGI